MIVSDDGRILYLSIAGLESEGLTIVGGDGHDTPPMVVGTWDLSTLALIDAL